VPRPLYRVCQFWRALTARVEPEEWRIVERLLTPEGVDLFRSMPRGDQRHSLDVLYTLQRQGHDAPELLAAALLHDVAKADGIRLWHRVAIVVAKAIRRSWLTRLAAPRLDSWRYAFFLYLHHPQRGAEQAKAVGCAPQTIELIQRHQEPVLKPARSHLDEWLIALQAADEER
jgi:hypothetical protein